MDKPASTPIDSILETSKEFNEAAERAASILQKLDTQLQQTGIGTAIYLQDGGAGLQTEEAGKRLEHRLGYDRVNGSWSICINRWHYDHERQRETQNEVFSLRSASRMLRLHFIEHVPALLALLQEKAVEQRELVKRRTSVLDTLEAVAGSSAAGGSERVAINRDLPKATPKSDKVWSARSLDRDPELTPNSDQAWSARSLDLLKKK